MCRVGRFKPRGLARWKDDPFSLVLVIWAMMSLGARFDCCLAATADAPDVSASHLRAPLTFNKDIAPLIFKHCAICHRPGQSAPFPLLSFENVKKHATDIASVTARRYMPPWLPEPGFGDFEGERRLSTNEIGQIQQWVAEGALEGNPSDLPPLPKWNDEWFLGQPDLIATMPDEYILASEGRDVYRNFVLPVPLNTARYVRAVEFHPGNPRITHHAFVKVDRTSRSRRLDLQDSEPGFPGMNVPAEMPGGHFLCWQPGKLPGFLPDGLAWALDPGSDLVLQVHLNPTGKPEPLRSSVGLYFTDRPPTNTCFKMVLTSLVLDISPGDTNYVVEDSFALPVDVQALAVLPHAHYLAREMKAWATLPDGTRQWLLFIKQWDFNWQGDYRYATPLSLPRGTTLHMRFTYDNSAANIRNPHNPPRPVTYGAQSTNEMAELWLQLLPRNKQDVAQLARDYQAKTGRVFLEFNQHQLRKNPNDLEAHTELGMLLMGHRPADAEQHFRSAIRSEPAHAPAHYGLGLLLRSQSKLPEARAEFETVLRLNERDYKAHGNLGLISLQQGNIEDAERHFKAALQLNPEDTLARDNLNNIQKQRTVPKSGRTSSTNP